MTAPVYAKVETAIPSITLGKAITETVRNDPFGALANLLQAAISGGVAATAVVLNSNTGEFTPVGSTVPLTSNQLADLSLSSVEVRPHLITDVVPFIKLTEIPWLEPALDAIEGDFQRVYDPQVNSQPVNFPQIATQPQFAPVSLSSPSPSPVVTLGPQSPTSYTTPRPLSIPSPTPTATATPTPTPSSPSPTQSTPTPLPAIF